MSDPRDKFKLRRQRDKAKAAQQIGNTTAGTISSNPPRMEHPPAKETHHGRGRGK